MHKTSIRVVDGNGWRRNSYAGSRRQLSLVGGPDGDAFFFMGREGAVGADHLEREPTGTLDSLEETTTHSNKDRATGRMEEARACESSRVDRGSQGTDSSAG